KVFFVKMEIDCEVMSGGILVRCICVGGKINGGRLFWIVEDVIVNIELKRFVLMNVFCFSKCVFEMV
uniref:hypothetical protein n=1 Tax=Bacillus altitudinis TaxID=293387 RepID=UPI001C92C0E4